MSIFTLMHLDKGKHRVSKNSHTHASHAQPLTLHSKRVYLRHPCREKLH